MKSGWAIKKLGEVCEEVKDRTSSIGVVLSAYITTDNMLKDCAGVCEAENLPPKVTSLVKFRKGDVLLSNIRPYLKKVWLADRDGGASSDVIVFRACSKEIQPRYIWKALARDEFFNYSMLNVSGTKMPRGKREWIKQFEIPIPPLPEQKRIVAKIDAAFEKIDKLKANAEKNLANAKELFQSALDEAMRPKDGWVEKRLGEVAEIQRGGSPRPIKDFITKNKDGYNWIKIGDVDPSGKFITSTAEKIRKEGLRKTRQVFAGEFLLSNSMSFGRPYILKIDGCIHDGWLVLRGFQKFYKEDFFYHLLRSKWIQNQFNSLAYGSTVRNLNSNSVSNVIVPIVALEEQQEIADSLDRLQSQAGVLQQNYSKQIADCMEMRQAVLREAFEGRL